MIRRLLFSDRTTLPLTLLNALATAITFYAFRKPHGGDLHTYVGLADGLLHGRYSFWWHLEPYIPDTFRNPGYPLFLLPFRWSGSSLLPVVVVQTLMYAASVAMMPGILSRLGGGVAARNIFLLLLLPSFNIAYFNTSIFPEIPVLFLITVFVRLATAPGNGQGKAVLLALTLGAAFQCRTTLLLFPAVWLSLRFLFHRGTTRPRQAMLFLLIFILTLVPYSAWNLRHHGVFKPTPIEGGAGVLHFAWWSGRIPGYQEHWYWGNFSSVEPVAFVPPYRVPAEVAAFDAEWRSIDSALAPLLTRTDSLMLDSFRVQKRLFRTYSAGYTLAREARLMAVTGAHMREEPAYTVAHMLYTSARLWVTGIQLDKFSSTGPAGKLAQIYPFLITFSILLIALFVIPIAMIRVPGLFRSTSELWCWILYFAMIQTPFVFQSRYTIPVRMLLFALIALCIERLLKPPAPRAHPGEVIPPR